MAVLCPQHKLSLVIVKRQIEIGGKIYPSTIGRCPQCRFAYINRKIFPGDNTTIGDETYQFLHELSTEFPPENVRNVQQEKKKEVKSKEPAKQEKKKAQKQEKKTKQNKKEKKTPTVRFAYHSNLQNTAPINMTVNYISYKIKRCPIDKCTLENKYISISVNGTVVKEVALVCPYCREAFINDTRRADIEKRVGEKKEVVTDQHKSQSKPKKQVTENEKTPANDFSYSSILQQLPLLEGNRGDCPFCKTALNNINVKYYMFGEQDKPALRYTYAWGCKNCEAVYLDNSQLEDVRRYSNKKRIYTIHASAYMDAKEMMKATKHPLEENMVANQPLPYENWNRRIENLSKIRNTIWVYTNKCSCVKCERVYGRKTITNRTAVIDSVMDRSISIDVMFCMGCGQYFVNADTVATKEKQYGVLLFERKYTPELMNTKSSEFDFEPDSILSRCGYSARAGISREYRQAILSYIIEGIGVNKSEIEKIMRACLKFHGKIKGHEEACLRWEEDLRFLHEYRLKYQKQIRNPQFEQVRKR